MEKLSMCRICLIKDVRLHCLVNTHLQEIYEFLSGHLLETKDARPLHACYMCCARLGNCLRLRTACHHSEELFSHLLNDLWDWEVTPSQRMNMLQTTPVLNISVGPVLHRKLKMDPSPMTDEKPNEEHVEDLQDNIIDQGICSQIIKQGDLKYENVSSEDEKIYCSIQNIKVESNSASDISLEHGTLERCVSKSNQSISSVDWKDILGDKTVKIVLHRMDWNSFRKPATVTEHLNPTDPKYTSQCNHLNHSENVEMLKPTICKEYKQIVHKSSDTHCRPNSDSLKHMRTHTGDTIYKCRICEKSFSKKSVLNIHIRRTHNDEKPHKCDRCRERFTSKSKLSIHIRSHTGEKPLQCTICDKCFNRSSNLLQHIRTHTGRKPYKCYTCGKDFIAKIDLLSHGFTHNAVKPYKCDTCGIEFISKIYLSSHIRTHTGEKPYQCDTCGKGFTRKSDLLSHIGTHNGVKPL